MNSKLRNYLLAAGGFAILAALVALTDPPHATAGPGPNPVIVVNTSANPVPITGTITNTPNVHVTNMPSVSFANTSATPLFVRDVDNAARHPFTLSCAVPASTGSSNTCLIPVPAGKELVIETESIPGVADPSNTTLAAEVIAFSGGSPQVATATIQDNGFAQPTQSVFSSSSSIKLYADPSTNIECAAGTKGPNPLGAFSFTCLVSGYFVTLP